MKSHTHRGAPGSLGAWFAAMLALAPLSGLFYAVRITGIGIA